MLNFVNKIKIMSKKFLLQVLYISVLNLTGENMLKTLNIGYQNVNFMGTYKIPTVVDMSLENFKNKMLADERYTNGHVTPEVRNAIESKILELKNKVRMVNPAVGNALVQPLQNAIKNNYDITATYLALGEFEKKLSDI